MVVTQDKLIEVLERSRELIKIGWSRSAWAKNSEGANCDPWSENAVCFCEEGAILGATHFEPNAEALAKACVTILQTANKDFMLDREILLRMSKGTTGKTTRIDKTSMIPYVNDGKISSQEQAIQHFTNAIVLVKKAVWK